MSVEEVRVFNTWDDPEASALKTYAKTEFGIKDANISTARVYRVEGATQDEIARLTDELFLEPLTQQAEIGPRQDWDDWRTVEVAYKPGVMNPQTESIMKGAHLLGVEPEAVDVSVQYHMPDLNLTQRAQLIARHAFNKTVQLFRWETPETLLIKGEVGPVNTVPIRELDEAQLNELSHKGSLFLDTDEMRTIRDHFRDEKRDPTDCELEVPAGRWSEHCGHKTFMAKLFVEGMEKDPLYPRIKETSYKYFDDDITSAFEDNAGVFRFYDGQCINIKLETHNGPSAIEPYAGAMTGTGGVLRDGIDTGQGAKVILSLDIFGFGPFDLPPEDLPEGCLHPSYLQQRVIDGVRDYGNRYGVPTANGSIHYDRDFRAKPTVMVGEVAIQPEQYARKGHPGPGDLVVTIGGRTGRDGIHGATFSSGEMTAQTGVIHSSAVQIGNPIEEKKMSDALIEARDAGLIRAITDCGAAGFSSAIGEMGEDIGVVVDINQAPLKYQGLAPWEIWMSESQERMVAAIEPENYEAFAIICAKHGTEIANLGTFGTPDGEPRLQVFYGEQKVVDLDYDFLKNGLKQREMVAKWERPQIEEIRPDVVDWKETIHKVMSHGNIASKEKVVRQYDHEVQGKTVMKPYGGVRMDAPNDAVVLTPILGKPYGLVVAHGLNPTLNNIDPYWGSVWAFGEGVSNYVAAGGDPKTMVYVNNFVTATPDEHVMGVLDKMVDAVTDCMDATKRPVISGKDSLASRYKNDDQVIDIPPVLNITVAGKIENIANTVSTDIKKPGSTLVLVGVQDTSARGGSILDEVLGGSSGRVPQVNLQALPHTLNKVHEAIQTGQVLACHDVSEGGVVTAVAEMCFGGDCGARLEPDRINPSRMADFLFNETTGCFVVEVESEEVARKLFQATPMRVLGKTIEEKQLEIYGQNEFADVSHITTVDVDELKASWKQPLEKVLL